MKLKIFFLCLCYSLTISLMAQEFPPNNENSFNYGHCLQEVFFNGTLETNYLTIRKDDDSGDYLPPHFIKEYPIDCLADNGNITKQAPVAYVSGTKAMVKAIFKSDCTNPYYIRGVGPIIATGQIIFPKQQLTPSNGTATYNYRLANIPFKDGKVKYWEEFTITWEVSESGDDNSWVYLDESKNPLYVTRGIPETVSTQTGYNWFHTLFKVGCESAAGETNHNSIINKIWNKLKTKSIVGADSGQSLYYYYNWLGCSNSFTTKSLLALHDGQCGSWARFFIDLLKIQHVTHSTVNDDFYHFKPSPNTASGFLVKDWVATIGQYSNINPVFKYTIIPKQNNLDFITLFKLFNTYNTHYSDLQDNPYTIGGQGPFSNPESIFGNHQITQINGQFKDPSYGRDFSSLQDIEDKAIFGYYRIQVAIFDEKNFLGPNLPQDLNGDGILETQAEVIVFLVTKDKLISQLTRTPLSVGSPFNH